MATSTTAIEDARQALSVAAARGDGGAAALRRFSDAVDELLQQLCDAAPSASGASLVVALGGYGRRQLCLGITKRELYVGVGV